MGEAHRLQGEARLPGRGKFHQGGCLTQGIQFPLDDIQELPVRHLAEAQATGFAVPADVGAFLLTRRSVPPQPQQTSLARTA